MQNLELKLQILSCQQGLENRFYKLKYFDGRERLLGKNKLVRLPLANLEQVFYEGVGESKRTDRQSNPIYDSVNRLLTEVFTLAQRVENFDEDLD